MQLSARLCRNARENAKSARMCEVARAVQARVDANEAGRRSLPGSALPGGAWEREQRGWEREGRGDLRPPLGVAPLVGGLGVVGEKVFGKPADVLQAAVGTAEAEHLLIEIGVLADDSATVDVELD